MQAGAFPPLLLLFPEQEPPHLPLDGGGEEGQGKEGEEAGGVEGRGGHSARKEGAELIDLRPPSLDLRLLCFDGRQTELRTVPHRPPHPLQTQRVQNGPEQGGGGGGTSDAVLIHVFYVCMHRCNYTSITER